VTEIEDILALQLLTRILHNLIDRFFWIIAAITRIAFLRQSVAIQAASVMPAYRAWKTGEHLLKTIAIKTRAGGRSRGWYLARGNLLARYALLVSFATKSH
jgi:hypothetical protein